jgi:hypothetical protein
MKTYKDFQSSYRDFQSSLTFDFFFSLYYERWTPIINALFFNVVYTETTNVREREREREKTHISCNDINVLHSTIIRGLN